MQTTFSSINYSAAILELRSLSQFSEKQVICQEREKEEQSKG
jgi:hypothetical protein